ncbi:hypothetical protein AOQ84DRAFT_55645 [Glonium stellatum]|uniref:NB-ARC domain-containing protein n=1 Tax=Glonium stellatum TaxID=574774 RepID=A0A8E2JS40_9PEZI|nr:hypothetical protein AOQ84DRAFT_55645 [Glonium stellatum]
MGLGGSGRTQLMLQYAWTRREVYGVVLWFDARNMFALEETFLLAASQLGLVLPPTKERGSISANALELYQSGLENCLSLLKRELRRRQQRWLLLFDEADDLSMIELLPRIFPSDLDGNVIVSSRRKEAYRLGRHAIEVTGLPTESAQDLLLYHARVQKPNKEQLAQAKEIVEHLDCIALAIDLAGS